MGIVREIPGYPGYQASSDGVILGKDGRPLKGWVDEDGYRHVSLRVAGRRNPKRVAVHRLVAVTFNGNPPSPEHEVRHDDGDPSNNRSSNLLWGTRADNAADKARHGRAQRGVNHPNARLTLRQVERIRQLRADGRSQQWIADHVGIGQSQVSRILRGVNWAA